MPAKSVDIKHSHSTLSITSRKEIKLGESDMEKTHSREKGNPETQS